MPITKKCLCLHAFGCVLTHSGRASSHLAGLIVAANATVVVGAISLLRTRSAYLSFLEHFILKGTCGFSTHYGVQIAAE